MNSELGETFSVANGGRTSSWQQVTGDAKRRSEQGYGSVEVGEEDRDLAFYTAERGEDVVKRDRCCH
jgi:hypothetical protein